MVLTVLNTRYTPGGRPKHYLQGRSRALTALTERGPSTRHRTLDFDFAKFLIVFPVLLFSMTAHEWAHGYAAWKQGDPTAYQSGYVTWNPIKYVDPIMTIIVIPDGPRP